jgi:tetratricopeptide (TPR) repeat protein
VYIGQMHLHLQTSIEYKIQNKMALYNKSFEENIEILYEELKLAIQWGRPSILLTVHRSGISRDKAIKALETRVKALGQNIIDVDVNQEHPDEIRRMLELKKPEKTVFFISNLDWGGGQDGKDAYMALNIYRESFVENQIRSVFWLTVNEASNLARIAPDFWAFRHRVIEFANPHRSPEADLPAGVLIWHIPDSTDTPDTIEGKIKGREELLSKLPDKPEALSARLELLYNLGNLYWKQGESQKALKLLMTGSDLSRSHALSETLLWLSNGMAIIRYEAGDYSKAAEILRNVIESHSQEGLLYMNLGISLYALGQKYEATSFSQRAQRSDPENARIWNSQGHLQLVMGRLDEASASFQKAIDLSPGSVAFHVSLAICFNLIGLTEKSLQRLAAARSQGAGRVFYLDICEQAILENPEASLTKLRAALAADQISRVEIQRDPNLNILFDASQLGELTPTSRLAAE